jgi:TrmH family RNA methyltransferase
MPDKFIESRQNAHYKLLKDVVAGGRSRRDHQMAWLEGARLCRTYQSVTNATNAILVMSTDCRIESIDTDVKSACAQTWLVDKKLFADITQVESPAGWGLIIPTGPPTTPMANSADVVVFDRIQDPGNAGMILRSAAAAGVRQVWAITGTVDLWSPKVLRAAMGAHFVMSIEESFTTERVVLQSQDTKLALFATANTPDAISLYSSALNLNQPVGWVFGQEGDGVSPELLSRLQTVVIPQSDKVESLNVAAAASICLFETLRRKRFEATN